MARKRHSKQAVIPPDRVESLRQSLVHALTETERTALELSETLGIPEREVYGHLLHIRRSFRRSHQRLRLHPAACLDCGFVFTKRGRLKKPTHCPLCHASALCG